MDDRLGTYSDEADAYAQCEAAGYTAMAFDFPAEENDLHWHDFNSLLFITAGSLTVTDGETGETRTCGAGTKLVGTKGFVHKEKTGGYSAIIGVDGDPAALTQPINKPLPVTL